MQNMDSSAALSPCVRLFLEMLCSESNNGVAPESRVFVFDRAVHLTDITDQRKEQRRGS
jgi:predicted phosphatase